MEPYVALPRVDAVKVRHQTAQQEIEGLRTRSSLLDVSRHLYPVTTVTSPWSVLGAEDELKEEEEPYPVERPLAPSRRPPWPPPELRPPPRLPRPTALPWRRPEPVVQPNITRTMLTTGKGEHGGKKAVDTRRGSGSRRTAGADAYCSIEVAGRKLGAAPQESVCLHCL